MYIQIYVKLNVTKIEVLVTIYLFSEQANTVRPDLPERFPLNGGFIKWYKFARFEQFLYHTWQFGQENVSIISKLIMTENIQL